MEHILKMLRIANAPTVPVGDDEFTPEADEPPDDRVPELENVFKKSSISSRKASAPGMFRRESLLTKAIQGDSAPTSPAMPDVTRGLSTTSSHSFASTAELTSDAESHVRSASPSPPPPSNRLRLPPTSKPVETGKVVIAPVTKDDEVTTIVAGEAAIEKTLGRKRCIMFACNTPNEPVKEAEVKAKVEEPARPELAPRKSRISFACPSRPSADSTQTLVVNPPPRRQSSPAPLSRKPSEQATAQPGMLRDVSTPAIAIRSVSNTDITPASPKQAFHEFASSHDETDEWVEKASEISRPKLTIDDCLKKELAIRKIGKEAEEEAEEEERERDALDNELDEDDAAEDDFAPSDEEARSDDGNESDNEEGFADSDDESDVSEYSFWAPSTTTRATSTDNMTHFSARQHSRSRSSSTSSAQSFPHAAQQARSASKIKAAKAIKMRPGTPELPDSTDFVCGTLDEDRPLEAAYISCREQRRREKHILIPQDIDPSFPTTDPEDEEDDDDDDGAAETADHIWMKNQFEGFDSDGRGRRPSAILVSPLHSPVPAVAPPRPARPALALRSTARSPPPKQKAAKSPPPRRLFDHPARRPRSPPPIGRLRSPRGSPTNGRITPFGITINHLAQRPNAVRVSSLPHTPNPFFRNWQKGSQPVSRITSGADTPGLEESHPDLHVRGPVDIVIGLEKKRQKRKEKFWRLHGRKVAKEQAEKRPPPGRGVERMKELGLECAERTRGYGLGQPAQLVLSL